MNKNLLLTVVFVGASTCALAQKPTEGAASSLEVQLNLTGDASTIVAPVLKYRYFIAPNMAIRFGLGLNSSSTTDNYAENGDGTGGKGEVEVKTMEWQVMPGFEYHCKGTDRLSPYAGITIGIGGGKQTEKWSNYDGTGYASGYNADSESPYSTFGVGLLAGVDFYFAQNFFVGAEMGLLMENTTFKEATATFSVDGNSSTARIPESKSSSMGIGETAALRLGWRF